MIPGWIGWLCVAAVAVIFAYMFYEQRKRKANDKPSHWYIPIDGFGIVWVPKECSWDEAEELAHALWGVQQMVWGMCEVAYEDQIKENDNLDWYMDTIGLGFVEPSPEHPNIVYFTAAHKIYIKFQPKMKIYFAHEVHNVFRCFLHGPAHIYDTVSEEDKEAAVWLQNKIDELMEQITGGEDELRM